MSLLLGVPLSINCSNLNKKLGFGALVSECSGENQPLVCGLFHLRRRQPLAQMNSNFCRKLWGKRATRKTVLSGKMIFIFQSREGRRTQTFCPLSPVLSHLLNWRFKQYLPGSVKMKAGLLRLRCDPKGHYLQRLLCNCVLLSP